MKPLSDRILQNDSSIDGHVHLFSHRGQLKDIPKEFVGFADIEFDARGEYTVDSLEGMYRKIVGKLQSKPYIGYRHYLLCTALTAEDAIELYNRFPEGTFQGFGELKLYDVYRKDKVPYKKISTVRTIARWIEKNRKGNLPIYIHWALDGPDDVKRLDNLLRNFPDQNIVLCHCGIDLGFMARDDSMAAWAWQQAASLARTYTNLWLDVSWDALNYLSINPYLIPQAPVERMFLGTDRNPAKYTYDKPRYTDSSVRNSIRILSEYINSDNNIKLLFS